jgi:hypothetical protein
MKRTFRMLGMMLAAVACVFPASPASAALVPLLSGGTAAPTGGTVSSDLGASYTVVEATSYTVSNSPGLVAATIYEDVVRVGSTYDFLFQVVNTGTSPIDGLNVLNYDGYTTSVDYLTNGSALTGGNFATDGTLGTIIDNRSSDSSTVTFNFDVPGPLGTELAPGATSYVLIVATSATNTDPYGSATASAGVAGNGSAGVGGVFEPASVPEPGSLVLGSLALISGAGVFGFRRLRRK